MHRVIVKFNNRGGKGGYNLRRNPPLAFRVRDFESIVFNYLVYEN